MATHYADYCEVVFSQETISADDMIEIETLRAIAIELIKKAPPSVVRDAGRTVELRFRLKDLK